LIHSGYSNIDDNEVNPNQNSQIPFLLVQTLVAILCLVGASKIAIAQEPDLNGWSGETEEFAAEIGANRPRMIPIADAPQEDLSDLSDDVRNQIGLAWFEEPDTAPISTVEPPNDSSSISGLFESQTETLTSREGLASSIKVALLLATLSLAPAIVLMTTCYVRVIVVLTLLKQAFGAQQLPPTQVLTALSLFVTLLVMTPVWNEVKKEAIDPYTDAQSEISWEEAWQRGIVPIKSFMAKQIEVAGNGESIALFYKYLPEESFSQSHLPKSLQTTSLASSDGSLTSPSRPASANDVPLNVLLPAFMVSELKVAFLLGFQIYLPFLVLDLVVSSVTVSTGMLMLPPTMVSFPLKLILFVLVDGWNLVVGMLLQSFAPFT
jgi:flagellar biosynthetic protein FliP